MPLEKVGKLGKVGKLEEAPSNGSQEAAPNNGADESGKSPTQTEKETTVSIYDKDEKLVEKIVTTERIKKV